MPFSPGGAPYPYGNSLGWRRFLHLQLCDVDQLPLPGELTYVARGTTAIVEAGPALHAGQLYVGGWDSTYEPLFGSSEDDSGTLQITGGSLTAAGCTIPPPCNLPPEQCPPPPTQECYLRLGYRGATGTIEQSGGTFTVGSILSIGMGAATSHGIYHLSGGRVFGGAFDVAVQGTGEFHVSGGEFISTCCASIVGRGYEYGGQIGTGLIPGYGLLEQSGGTITSPTIYVGFTQGSVGEVALSGAAELVTTAVVAGEEGEATIVQEGGTLKVHWWLLLGEKAGSAGSYEISGGNLNQTVGATHLLGGVPVADGVHVGRAGRGEFSVVGSGGTIDIAGVYQQSSDSLLTVKVDPDAPHLSPIEVAGTATFAAGAKLKIELLDGYTPPRDAVFTVLTAQQILGPAVQIVDDPEVDWTLFYDGLPANALKIVYRRTPGCGLLGIEPFVLVLLLRAAARRRRR